MRTRATAVLAAAAMVAAAAGCGDLASIGDQLDDKHQFEAMAELGSVSIRAGDDHA